MLRYSFLFFFHNMLQVTDLNERVSGPVSSHIPLPTPTFKRSQQKADDILENSAKRLDAPSHVEKPHDVFGKYIAEKLRSVPVSMVPYCQKIINEAIFLAEIESLNVTSRITTDQETLVSSPPTPRISRLWTVMEDNCDAIKQDNTDD